MAWRPVQTQLSVIRRVKWSEVEGWAALRCAVGVAIPLTIGFVVDEPLVGVFGAAGAVGVGFGSFQGAYRGRAAVMLIASVGMAVSVFSGSLTGHSTIATVLVAGCWAFGAGLMVTLGQGASYVGLQSIVALLIAGGYPSDFTGAAGRAALVIAGGLIQTVLVVGVWPFRRFLVERRNLAAVYRTLAGYATTIPTRVETAPEPHTLADTASPLLDPQPFARSEEVLVFQALLDQAERIRASLAAFAVHFEHFDASDRECARTVADLTARALREIADALDDGRQPRRDARLVESLSTCASRLSSPHIVEPLLAQMRGAWRMAGTFTAEPDAATPPRGPLRRSPRAALRDGIVTLRANLTLRSTAARHALRLATVLTMATAGARLLELPRGYWVPMTIALVLKPDFHDTFAFSIGRVCGTILGAAGAAAVVSWFDPGPQVLILLVLGVVWVAYAFRTANYVLSGIGITSYVVFLMTLAGLPQVIAATDRVVYTTVGGLLALGAYAVWPTWAAREVRAAIATMLEAQARYVEALFGAVARPAAPDLAQLSELRASARVARSNAEALVEQMLSEPRTRHSMTSRTALGLVRAAGRGALAALSLHAWLERDDRLPLAASRDLARPLGASLTTMAMSARMRSGSPPLAGVAQAQVVLTSGQVDAIGGETTLLVDSIEAMAALLATDAAERAGVPT